MERFKRCLKAEFDTEFYSCIHAMAQIWMYGFVCWIWKDGDVSFLIITEMFIVGYVLAWIQRFVFWRDRIYSPTSFKIRVCLWNVAPMILTAAGGSLMGWFDGMPLAAGLTFYGALWVYYIVIWWILQYFYKSETKQLNTLLSAYQKKERESDGQYH